jgi:hypothetical protein
LEPLTLMHRRLRNSFTPSTSSLLIPTQQNDYDILDNIRVDAQFLSDLRLRQRLDCSHYRDCSYLYG